MAAGTDLTRASPLVLGSRVPPEYPVVRFLISAPADRRQEVSGGVQPYFADPYAEEGDLLAFSCDGASDDLVAIVDAVATHAGATSITLEGREVSAVTVVETPTPEVPEEPPASPASASASVAPFCARFAADRAREGASAFCRRAVESGALASWAEPPTAWVDGELCVRGIAADSVKIAEVAAECGGTTEAPAVKESGVEEKPTVSAKKGKK